VWRRWFFLPIAAFIIAADQLTKFWIINSFPLGYQSAEVLHFSIVRVCNTGSAFGMFTDKSFILSIVAIAGIIVILVFYRKLGASSRLAGLAIGLVLGGAIGNLTSRIWQGCVTDFINFRFWGNFYWPAYNVADSCLTVGIILLIWFILTTMTKKDAPKT
jgi:signal peptidase II